MTNHARAVALTSVLSLAAFTVSSCAQQGIVKLAKICVITSRR